MATLKQIAANRANAEKSTGPRTDAGKAAAAQNATTSGLYAKSLIIPGEDPDLLDALRAEYLAEFSPATAAERDHVDTLVHTEWLRRRLRLIEAASFNDYIARAQRSYENDDLPYDHTHTLARVYDAIGPRLDLIRRRLSGLDRTYRQTLSDLHRLQAARRAAEPPPVLAPVPRPRPRPRPSPQLASFQHPPTTPAPTPPPLIK